MTKKLKIKSPTKTISNLNLIVAAGVIVFAAFLGIYWKLLATQTSQNWLKNQAQNLSSALTGNNPEMPLTGGQRSGSVNVPIFLYHHVGPLPSDPDLSRRDMTISTDDFELHVAWLKGQGYESISLKDLLLYKKGEAELPSKPVIFTFDGGYSDVFENAIPTLIKYGYTASLAIITQFPGISQGSNDYASWQQIKQAQKQGFEIISLTQDYFDGTNPAYDQAFILRNLTDSQKDIKNSVGTVLPILAYPYGRYNDEYIGLAKQAGFEIGLTAKSGQIVNLENLMEAPRIRIYGYTKLEQFKKLIRGSEQEPDNLSF